MFRNLFTIIVLCFYTLSLSVSTLTGKSDVQMYLVSEQFLEELSNSLSHLSDFEISTKKEKHLNTYSYLNKSMKNIQTCNFRSQKHLMKNSAGKIFLHFKLFIIEYENAAFAQAALDTLLDSSDPNIGLSYAWDYVCKVGKRVYWLSAPCLLSTQDWRQITAKLKKIVPENQGEINSFECRCGLNCRRQWKK